MCGLVGMMGDFYGKHKDMFTDLLFLDTLRGFDATGVACVRSNGDIDVLKRTIPGSEFITLKEFDNIIRLTDCVWIGHNRYGTIGKNHRLNAHPFEVQDKDGETVLVGAHNGTLKNKYELDPHPAKYGTDSEALYNKILEVGINEAIKNTEGAWALSWYSLLEDAVFLLRNKERPLCFAYSEDHKQVFWASEAWMLRAAAERRDVKLDSILYPKEDTLIRFDVPSKKGNRVIPDFHAEGGLEGKTPKPTFSNQGGTRSYNPDNYSYRTTPYWEKDEKTGEWTKRASTKDVEETAEETGPKGGKTTTSTALTTTTSGGGTKPDLNDKIRGYEGAWIKLAEVKGILAFGCAWCDDALDMKSKFGWIDPGTVVCSSCLHDKHAEVKVDLSSSETKLKPVVNKKQRNLLQSLMGSAAVRKVG